MINKDLKIIDVKGNIWAKEPFALVQIGNRNLGKDDGPLPFPHYYYEENMNAKDFFIEILDLLEFYQNIKIVY